MKKLNFVLIAAVWFSCVSYSFAETADIEIENVQIQKINKNLIYHLPPPSLMIQHPSVLLNIIYINLKKKMTCLIIYLTHIYLN